MTANREPGAAKAFTNRKCSLKKLSPTWVQNPGQIGSGSDYRGNKRSRFFGGRVWESNPGQAAINSLEQLRGFWNTFGTKSSVFWAIFGDFQVQRQSNHQEVWSGRWESNPRPKLGNRQIRGEAKSCNWESKASSRPRLAESALRDGRVNENLASPQLLFPCLRPALPCDLHLPSLLYILIRKAPGSASAYANADGKV
jgi:hypothetical protein